MFKTITIWNKTCLFPISEWWVTLFSKIYQIFRIYWHISLLVSVYISIIPMRLTKEHTFWKYMYLLNLKFVRDTHVRWSKVITSATQDIDANENLDNTYVRQKKLWPRSPHLPNYMQTSPKLIRFLLSQPMSRTYQE